MPLLVLEGLIDWVIDWWSIFLSFLGGFEGVTLHKKITKNMHLMIIQSKKLTIWMQNDENIKRKVCAL